MLKPALHIANLFSVLLALVSPWFKNRGTDYRGVYRVTARSDQGFGHRSILLTASVELVYAKLWWPVCLQTCLKDRIQAYRVDNVTVRGDTIFFKYRPIRHGLMNTIFTQFQKMFTTENQGRSVEIRQDRRHLHGDKMDDRLRKIYLQWIRHGKPTDGYPVERTMPYRDNYFASPARTPVETRRSTEYVPVETRRSSEYVPENESRFYSPPRPPPQPANKAKDDSWCAIL